MFTSRKSETATGPPHCLVRGSRAALSRAPGSVPAKRGRAAPSLAGKGRVVAMQQRGVSRERVGPNAVQPNTLLPAFQKQLLSSGSEEQEHCPQQGTTSTTAVYSGQHQPPQTDRHRAVPLPWYAGCWGCLRQVSVCGKRYITYTFPGLPSPTATPRNMNQSKNGRCAFTTSWQQSPSKPVTGQAILATERAEQSKTQPKDHRNEGLELLDEKLCIFFVLSHLHPPANIPRKAAGCAGQP